MNDRAQNEKITMAHGSGGLSTGKLIEDIFAKHFNNEILSRMEDSAVVEGSERIAVTTDSFVVKPLEFPGGDIGSLAVCGTVNDLLMSGSTPKYLTAGFILEDGLDIALLERLAASMQKTAEEAGVKIVSGDTKVVEGTGGLIINTAGVGFVPEGVEISPSGLKDGDRIILTGNLGEHHAAILGSRMGIENDILSDAAPLTEMIGALMNSTLKIHAMRDVTRGGLGTVLNEFAHASGVRIELEEAKLPVSDKVKSFAGILGLDPVYMGNEGKAVISVAEEDAEEAVNLIRKSRYGERAAIVGKVSGKASSGEVILHTAIGGRRIIKQMYGEGLPRIC